METVVLITRSDAVPNLRQRIPATFNVSSVTTAGMVIEDGRTRIYLNRNDDIRNEFETARLERIVALVANPAFFTIDFSDIEFCRKLLLAIGDDPTVLLDNDHGLLLPGPDFVSALRYSPGWDWRVEPKPLVPVQGGRA